MNETVIIALITALTSGGMLAFIQYLIERHDKKKGNNIGEKLITLEKDGLRTQLLFMLCMQPEEETEILKIAEHYFVKLQGNWYMTSLFAKWCDKRGLEPEWFNRKE